MIWTHKLRLGDIYQEAVNTLPEGQADIKVLGKAVACRLRKLSLPEDFSYRQEKIASQFESCEDMDEFDNIMEDLYDLGDFSVGIGSKLIWVDTFSPSIC